MFVIRLHISPPLHNQPIAKEVMRENGVAKMEKSWILLCEDNAKNLLKTIQIVSLQCFHVVPFVYILHKGGLTF